MYTVLQLVQPPTVAMFDLRRVIGTGKHTICFEFRMNKRGVRLTLVDCLLVAFAV